MSPRPMKFNGAIAWMAGHPVAANLLMLGLLLGGVLSALRIKQEVFPEFSLDVIGISIPYPGASPSEVETGILMVTEDSVRGIEGVKQITSTASEGRGSVSVELLASADIDRALQDVKNAIDRIVTYPVDIERPTVSLLENRNKVITLAVYGPFQEKALRDTAEMIRDGLSVREDVTMTELGSGKGLEISVEIPSETLRSYGLTPAEVAQRIRNSSVEVPAGSLRTEAGEILIRTSERREFGREFADIPIISRADGSMVRLGEMAEINDGFQDVDVNRMVNGQPALLVDVYCVGLESPISISEATAEYLASIAADLPDGMVAEIIEDEHPQIIAIVLASLDDDHAAQVLAALPEAERGRCEDLAPFVHVLTHKDLHLHPVRIDGGTPQGDAARWVEAIEELAKRANEDKLRIGTLHERLRAARRLLRRQPLPRGHLRGVHAGAGAAEGARQHGGATRRDDGGRPLRHRHRRDGGPFGLRRGAGGGLAGRALHAAREPPRAAPRPDAAHARHRLLRQPGRSGRHFRCRAGRALRGAQCRQSRAAV